MRKVLLPVLLFLVLAAIAAAQTVAGLGGLSGIVRDTSGASVPNASVIVVNEAKGIRRTLATNEAGIFAAPALVPAPGYKVTVNAAGFAPFEARDIQIEVGQQVDLPITLAVATAATHVEVSAAAPIVEDTKTDVSQVVNTHQIQELPINGRRVDSFVLLTPAVTADGAFGLLSFRGTVGGNTFLTDGNDTTQQFFNENGGRTRISSQISQDAVQEFQVLSAGYTAEYGRAIGGVVNTVTRSGTNDPHGTLYWFFRNQDFNARDRYASFNPPEARHQAGASLGGPIVRDKLFYFGNFELTRRDFPIASSIQRPGAIENGVFVGCGAPATAAQCEAINGLLPRFFGAVPRTVNQDLAFAKIDYRPGEKHSFSFSGNYLRWVSPNGIQSAATLNNGAALGSNGISTVRNRLARASWTAIVTPNSLNELRAGWFKDRQADDVNGALAPPFQVTLSVGGQTNLGVANYLPRINPSENRYQIADTFTWTKGRHSTKYGFDFSSTEDYINNPTNQLGSYTYGNVTAFAQDFTGNAAGAKNYQSYSQTLGNPVVRYTMRDYALFAQDQFRVSPKLTLNLGLRYDLPVLPQPAIVNPDYRETGRIPEARRDFAPRVGIAYSMFDGTTVLRAGYGIFFGRFPGGLVNTLMTNNAVYAKSIFISNPRVEPTAPVFPNRLSSSNLPGGTSSITFAAEDLRMPYTQHGDIAVEQRLARNLGLTVSYIFGRGVQLFTVRDLNIGPLGPVVTYTIQDASGNNVGAYATPVYLQANSIDKRYQRINLVENGGRSYYDGLAVQLRKRMSKGLQASVAYTWSHAIDTDLGSANFSSSVFFSGGPQGLYNGISKLDKGSANNDQRHRLVSTLVAAPHFTARTDALSRYLINNWQLSAIVTIASSYPSTATINVSNVIVNPAGRLSFTGSLNGFGGDNRVPFWPLNSLSMSPIWRADARVSKLLPFSERFKLYLNFEAFNITNSQYDTSVNTQAYSASNGVLKPTAGLGVGRASGGFPDGTNARRAQVGMRLVF